jgi:STAS domain
MCPSKNVIVTPWSLATSIVLGWYRSSTIAAKLGARPVHYVGWAVSPAGLDEDRCVWAVWPVLSPSCDWRRGVAEPVEHPTALPGGLWPLPGPRTVVVVVDGPLSRRGIAGLCTGARRLLATGEVDLITYDMGAVVEPDVMAIEALARLQLTARRLRGSIQVRHVSGELRDMLDMAGLCAVVPLCDESPLGSGGQVEEAEQARVEEGVDRGDPTG